MRFVLSIYIALSGAQDAVSFCSRNGDLSVSQCCIDWEEEEANLKLLNETRWVGGKWEYNHTVPRKVWAFWLGPAMVGSRAVAFESLKKNIGLPVELVTPDNLFKYEVPEHPFHPAVKYSIPGLTGKTSPTGLSAVHVVDYFRVYFMHHYGGGYHDVKPHESANSWNASFDAFSDPEVWAVGVGEKWGYGCHDAYFSGEAGCYALRSAGISCCSEAAKSHKDWAISNGAYILRAKTRLSYEWLRDIECDLTAKFEELKKRPAPIPRCCQNGENYPIRWTELHGEAFGALQYKFRSHVRQGLPAWSFAPYRGADEDVIYTDEGVFPTGMDVVPADKDEPSAPEDAATDIPAQAGVSRAGAFLLVALAVCFVLVGARALRTWRHVGVDAVGNEDEM